MWRPACAGAQNRHDFSKGPRFTDKNGRGNCRREKWTVINAAQGLHRETRHGWLWRFTKLLALPPGSIYWTIETKGFRKFEQKSFAIAGSTRRPTVNATLEVGSASGDH